mgnify:CR=1 FL=1
MRRVSVSQFRDETEVPRKQNRPRGVRRGAASGDEVTRELRRGGERRDVRGGCFFFRSFDGGWIRDGEIVFRIGRVDARGERGDRERERLRRGAVRERARASARDCVAGAHVPQRARQRRERDQGSV